MHPLTPVLLATIFLGPAEVPKAPPANRAATTVGATLETTLGSASDRIGQLAFDGDPETFFESGRVPSPDDHVSLVFDGPVDLTRLDVTTGRADGSGRLEGGTLELSEDGTVFRPAARFSGGRARVATARRVVAIRIRPPEKLGNPLVVREIALASNPPVVRFTNPVEFRVDVHEAPEMKAWAESAARACTKAYPMICDELRSDGFRPPRVITMVLSPGYDGVAMTTGTRITGAVRFFKAHPDDVGAMIHETAHVVQDYRGRDNPGWLVEGVADYVRFFKFEPGKIGRIDPRRARHDGSYRVTAAFLAFVAGEYDPRIVLELNEKMRQGTYRPELFKEITGKSLDQLDEEWRRTLTR